MAELLNAGKYGVVQSMELKEGDVTVKVKNTSFGRMRTFDFEHEVEKGDFLKLVGPNQLAKCTADADVPVAVATAEPYFPGAEPKVDSSYGEYENRRVSAELFGKKVKTVKLAASNSKIVVGDPITLASAKDQTYDKGSSGDRHIALTEAAANAGGLIIVLFGAELL